MNMVVGPCKNCGREVERHSKDFCITCYKKLMWKPRLTKCTRCHRQKPMHAKGLCGGCYNFVYHLDNTKASNQKKNYNLDYDIYKKITEKCAICDFSKFVELHHLDENKKNSQESNLVGLCPNHHKMLHDFRYRKEMRDLLKEKGYVLPHDVKLDFEKK